MWPNYGLTVSWSEFCSDRQDTIYGHDACVYVCIPASLRSSSGQPGERSSGIHDATAPRIGSASDGSIPGDQSHVSNVKDTTPGSRVSEGRGPSCVPW